MADPIELDTAHRTSSAFAEFRTAVGSPRDPPARLIKNDGELQLMTLEDGLERFVDGPVDIGDSARAVQPRLIEQSELEHRHIWAVRSDDVVHAQEYCQFGKSLPTGVIKHTNLTGGAPAYAGGELLRFGTMIVVNGQSGRYHPRSAEEMSAVALAFARSGYHVWSMGYDPEADFPYPFIGVLPQCVA